MKKHLSNTIWKNVLYAFTIVKRFLTKPIFKDNIFAAIVGLTFGFLSVFLMLYVVNFVNQVTQDIVFATGIMAIGTLVLAFFTYWNIRSRNVQEKSDREDRLLKEIIEWAEDINIASLTPDVSFKARDSAEAEIEKAERDVNTLMRYGISRSKAISILTIVEECFKDELQTPSQKVFNELLKFTYFKQMALTKRKPNERDFPENILTEITQEIAKGDKSIGQLFEDHAKALSTSVHALLTEANKIRAGLLR